MNGPTYTVDIERLVLIDMGQTPVEAEQLRVQMAGELQRLLKQRDWSGGMASADVTQASLPSLPLDTGAGNGRWATTLAQHIALVLPGAGQTEVVR